LDVTLNKYKKNYNKSSKTNSESIHLEDSKNMHDANYFFDKLKNKNNECIYSFDNAIPGKNITNFEKLKFDELNDELHSNNIYYPGIGKSSFYFGSNGSAFGLVS